VNFSGIDDTADVMACNPGLDVSSNIFAWHSSAALGITGCVPHDSLFDTLIPAPLVGANRQADTTTFFVDLDGGNLHLASASPARGIGQPGIVDVDIDGGPAAPAGRYAGRLRRLRGTMSQDLARTAVDLNGKVLHPPATSPAKGLALPGWVDVDLEWKPCPDPPASRPGASASGAARVRGDPRKRLRRSRRATFHICYPR
jgi:hypothetical protein